MLRLAQRFVFACTVASTLLTTGCKLKSSSSLKHDFGQIADAGDLAISCQRKSNESLGVDQDFLAYLTDHLTYLIAANRSVLPADFNTSRLCPKILDNYEINASAEPTGVVNAYRGILWIAETDAQFAAVFAHELAHTLSIHPFAPNQNPRLLQDSKYVAVCRGIRELYLNTFNQQMAEINSALEQLGTFLGKLKLSSDLPLIKTYFRMYGPLVSKLEANSNNQNQDLYSVIINTPFDPANQGIAARFDPDAALFVGVEDMLRMFQDQRNQVLKAMGADQQENFVRLEQAALESLARQTASLTELGDLAKQRREKENMVLGDEIAANWSEQAADEKGLELFVRAGYDPKQFILMLQNLGKSRQVAKEAIIDLSPPRTVTTAPDKLMCKIAEHFGTACERGKADHPTSCWRVEDLQQELVHHQADYATLIPAQPKVTVFGDRLSRLRSYYYSALPNLAVGYDSPVPGAGTVSDVPTSR